MTLIHQHRESIVWALVETVAHFTVKARSSTDVKLAPDRSSKEVRRAVNRYLRIWGVDVPVVVRASIDCDFRTRAVHDEVARIQSLVDDRLSVNLSRPLDVEF